MTFSNLSFFFVRFPTFTDILCAIDMQRRYSFCIQCSRFILRSQSKYILKTIAYLEMELRFWVLRLLQQRSIEIYK